MDECTHLKNFAVPVDTSLAIAVCADNDAYVPDRGMINIKSVWPDAEVRYVKGGHVRAYVQYQKEFRYEECSTKIIESLFRRFPLSQLISSNDQEKIFRIFFASF